LLSFEIDIKNELGCIVMDEAHYINDVDRGAVWEETILLADPNIQLLLLSATLSKPELLAKLIENRGGPEIYICPTTKRQVPLSHFGFLTIPESYIKTMSDSNKNKYESILNKPIILKPPDEEGGNFNDQNYEKIKKFMNFANNNNIRINRFFVINNIVKYVKENSLLPAIMFVFSRKQVNIIAEKIQVPLFEEDSKIPSIIDQECKKLLKSKLKNWQEYTSLPEYTSLIKLLEKGVAIHHAGILKEFREMVELLFDKKYIKLLIATETFAVGINMPTKTTIFTSLEKFDGNNFRNLEPSEYTQMAGRAGRRGIDTKGIVIHANNLFNKSEIATKDYRHILTGPPKTISSKFNIHLNLLLHLISGCPGEYEEFITQSLIKNDIDSYKSELERNLSIIKENTSKIGEYNTDIAILEELFQIEEQVNMVKPKQKKKFIRKYNILMETEKTTKIEYTKYLKHKKNCSEEEKIINEYKKMDTWIQDTCDKQINILVDNEFVCKEDNGVLKLTNRGKYATCLQEVFSLPFSEAIDNNLFKNITAQHLVAVLSCFTNIKLSDENSVYSINHMKEIAELIKKMERLYNKYTDIHNANKLVMVETCEFHLNLAELISKWCVASNEDECKIVLKECLRYDISLGDFVKSVLKINNIAKEIEKVAIIKEDIDLLYQLKQIPELTLKYCVTNQSLYL
jgi:superfamily II RNA helicase